MEELLKLMKARIEVLKKAIAKAQKDQGKGPEGRLRISCAGGKTRYYHVTDPGCPTGTYITKKRRSIIRSLILKDYNAQFLKQANCEMRILKLAVSLLEKSNADQAFLNLHEKRKEFITPYILTKELYARQWQAKAFEINNYMKEDKIYPTKKGEYVRSKSEAILADMLNELGIPYHYEKRLNLKNGQYRYPDFTLLKVRTGEEIYMEHFGMWDEERYREDSLRKLDDYRANGIYPGKNLIFTYETATHPLDIKGIKTMLRDLFQ